MRLEAHNKIGDLARISSALEHWADEEGVPSGVKLTLHLVLEEIFSNIVSYGYPPGETGAVRIVFQQEPGFVILQFEDEGTPFNPLEAPEADVISGLAERTVGGLGIHLVRQMTDEVTYHRRGSWNVLQVRKNSSPVEEKSVAHSEQQE